MARKRRTGTLGLDRVFARPFLQGEVQDAPPQPEDTAPTSSTKEKDDLQTDPAEES